MDEMTALVYDTADYLGYIMHGIGVEIGYMPMAGQRPLKEAMIFVSPAGRSGDRVSVKAAVYTPSLAGGVRCSEYAEELFGQIHSELFPAGNGRILENAEIGRIEYDARAAAFTASVIITTVSKKEYLFTADMFSKAGGSTISGKAESYEIVRSFETERYFEVFEDMPIGITDGENTYEITINNAVPNADRYGSDEIKKMAEAIGNGGEFRLKIGGEVFGRCLCRKAQQEDGGAARLVISGYRGEDNDFDTDEIIVH